MSLNDKVGLKMRGQLKLVVCGSTNKITVTILALRSLPDLPSNQVYIKMSLSPDSESRLRHKTSTYDITNELVRMHETFTFDTCRRDFNRRLLISVWMKNKERTILLGCTSFGVRSIMTSQEVTQGWYYLLKESLGRSKHLKFKFAKSSRQPEARRRPKSRDRRSDSSNSSLSSSLYRSARARRCELRHDDVMNVTSLSKRRRLSSGLEYRPNISQSHEVIYGFHDNNANGLYVPKMAIERKSRDVMNLDVTKVGKTPTGRRHIKRKNYSPDDVMIARLSYCVDDDADDDVFDPPITSSIEPANIDDITLESKVNEVVSDITKSQSNENAMELNSLGNTADKLFGNTATPVTKQRRLSLDSLLKLPFVGTIDNKICDVIKENDVTIERCKSKPSAKFGLKSWLSMQRKHDEAKIRGNIGVGRSTNRSLAQLLTNKHETSAFRTFLQSEFSEENLNFWLDCESFKQIKPNKIRKVAAKIYEQYLEVGSPNEINIDAKTRDLIQSNLANPNIEIFNQAQSRIFKLMESDSFRRFRLKAA